MAPKSCRPSDGDRSHWTIVQKNPLRMTPWKSTFVEDAIKRLSKSEYNLLESFRSVFPTLHVECCPRPCNAFMLYRSHYVASIETESSTNQMNLSKDASKLWNTLVDQGPYLVWANDIRRLWYRMYPGRHLPARVREELKKQTQKKNGSSYRRRRTNKAQRNKFQHYPSPSVSEATDLVEGSIGSHGDQEGSDYEPISGDEDEEYLPNREPSPSPSMSSIHNNSDEYQLPTPALTIRELSPSPVPVFSDPESPKTPQPSPVFQNISLAELNHSYDPEYSTFFDLHELNSLSSSAHCPFDYPNQIAAGYREHSMDTITDWDQTSLMSDLDPVGLHPVIIDSNIPYPDISSDLTTENSLHLDLLSFPSCGPTKA